jgi:2,3-bisphosphoglycerate-dependent phosphoglycerate mutase
MSLLIFIRHGQSAWNLENRFTGVVDVDLTAQGEAEARRAGTLLRNYEFGEAHTSVLKRAIHTLAIVLEETGKSLQIFETPALNERNYGDLQGLNKSEMEKKYGEKQVP